MINGLFKEISEEEMMSVNGGCGGGGSYHNLGIDFDCTGVANVQVNNAKAIANACSYLAVCIAGLSKMWPLVWSVFLPLRQLRQMEAG